MVSPCLRKCQNTRENSEEHGQGLLMLEKTDSKFVMVVALLLLQGWYLSNKQPPDLLVNVMATNDALQSTCLMVWHVEQGSSESTGHYFATYLLSDYFLLSACLLLSAYFLAVSCYKRMHLTTSAYGNKQRQPTCLAENGHATAVYLSCLWAKNTAQSVYWESSVGVVKKYHCHQKHHGDLECVVVSKSHCYQKVVANRSSLLTMYLHIRLLSCKLGWTLCGHWSVNSFVFTN